MRREDGGCQTEDTCGDESGCNPRADDGDRDRTNKQRNTILCTAVHGPRDIDIWDIHTSQRLVQHFCSGHEDGTDSKRHERSTAQVAEEGNGILEAKTTSQQHGCRGG